MSEQSIREQARALLPEHATQLWDGRWHLNTTPGYYPRTEDETLDVIEACLLLDVPITDVIKGSSWLAMVKRVVALEERVGELQPPKATGQAKRGPIHGYIGLRR